MSAAEEIIAEAEELLLTYERALHTKGQEIAELRSQGLPWSRIAALYPYDVSEWDAGISRLTCTKPYRIEAADQPEAHFARDLVEPSQFTSAGWRWMHRLMAELPLSAPAFEHASEATHRRYVNIGASNPLGADPYTYLEVLIWLLHVLATSPEMPKALKDRRTIAAACKVLALASEIAPILDQPQPEAKRAP